MKSAPVFAFVLVSLLITACTPIKKPTKTAATSAPTAEKPPRIEILKAPAAPVDIAWTEWAPAGLVQARIDWPAGAAWGRGKLYVVGSRRAAADPKKPEVAVGELVFYEVTPSGGREAAVFKNPQGERAGAAALASPDNRIWVIGGSYSAPPLKTVPEGKAEFAPLGVPIGQVDIWTPGAPELRSETLLPVPRGEAGVCFGGIQLYVIGGAFDKTLPDDERNKQINGYDPRDGLWTKFHDFRYSLLSPATAVVRDGLFIIGGKQLAPSFVTNAVWRYDLQVFKWQKQPPLPAPRAAARAFAVGNAVYVIGGKEKEGLTSPGKLALRNFRFDLDKRQWEELSSPLPEGSTLVAFDGAYFYVVGGEKTYRGENLPTH